MSRGLGAWQRLIKQVLTGFGSLPWADIRDMIRVKAGHQEISPRQFAKKLHPDIERSMKRALKGLVDRREVMIVGGKGRSGDPYRYAATVSVASIWSEKKVTDLAEALKLVLEMQNVAEQFAKKLAEALPLKP